MAGSDLRTWGMIWEPKLIEFGNKSIDLTACGVTGNGFRAWEVIWERKLKDSGDTFMISKPEHKLRKTRRLSCKSLI